MIPFQTESDLEKFRIENEKTRQPLSTEKIQELGIQDQHANLDKLCKKTE